MIHLPPTPPDAMSALRALGYTDIPASKLIEMKIFGVTPEYIRKLEDSGYKGVPVDKMIKMKMSGLVK